MSLTARMLGVLIPVFIATTFCLTVPFIIIVADAAILTAAIVAYVSERVAPRERSPEAVVTDS